jgi:hypothetical protein
VRRLSVSFVLLLSCAVPAMAQQTPTPQVSEQQTKTLNLSAYAELLRSDVRAEKVAILTEVLALNEAEDKAFWPIYREYDQQMAALGDERVALIAEYAKNYSQMTDPLASTLMSKAIDLDNRRKAALAACAEKVKTALSPRMALKFLQVEHQLLLIIDLQIAAALPVVK